MNLFGNREIYLVTSYVGLNLLEMMATLKAGVLVR